MAPAERCPGGREALAFLSSQPQEPSFTTTLRERKWIDLTGIFQKLACKCPQASPWLLTRCTSQTQGPVTSGRLDVRLLFLTALLEPGRPRSGPRWRPRLSLPGICSRTVTGCAEPPGVLVAGSDGRQSNRSSVAFRIVLGGGCQQEPDVESGPSLPRAPAHREGGGRGPGGLRMEWHRGLSCGGVRCPWPRAGQAGSKRRRAGQERRPQSRGPGPACDAPRPCAGPRARLGCGWPLPCEPVTGSPCHRLWLGLRAHAWVSARSRVPEPWAPRPSPGPTGQEDPLVLGQGLVRPGSLWPVRPLWASGRPCQLTTTSRLLVPEERRVRTAPPSE